jgi:hypothetical protein
MLFPKRQVINIAWTLLFLYANKTGTTVITAIGVFSPPLSRRSTYTRRGPRQSNLAGDKGHGANETVSRKAVGHTRVVHSPHPCLAWSADKDALTTSTDRVS